MNTITQKVKFRQSLINYAEKYGVTKRAKENLADFGNDTLLCDDFLTLAFTLINFCSKGKTV